MRELPRGCVVFWLQIDVGHVNDGAGRDAPSRSGRRVRKPGRLVAQTLPRAWRAARSAARWMDSPSQRNTVTDHACTSRAAFSAIASKTGCTSACERLMTPRMSLVAVCVSKAVVSSRLLVCSSVKSRTFSIAMIA